jgi:hypothetical protein
MCKWLKQSYLFILLFFTLTGALLYIGQSLVISVLAGVIVSMLSLYIRKIELDILNSPSTEEKDVTDPEDITESSTNKDHVTIDLEHREEILSGIMRRARIASIIGTIFALLLAGGLVSGTVWYSNCERYIPQGTALWKYHSTCKSNQAKETFHQQPARPSFVTGGTPIEGIRALEEERRRAIEAHNNEFRQNLEREYGAKGLLFDTQTMQPIASDYNVFTIIVPEDTSDAAERLIGEYNILILDVLRSVKFPSSLLQQAVVGLVSPTFKGGDVAVSRPGGLTSIYRLPANSPHGVTITPETAIFIFGSALGDRFKATFAHELGHVLANDFTSADWIEWARIRGAPTQQYATEWQSKASEDFAEEFKRYSNDYQGDPSIWGNKTAWGSDSWSFWTKPNEPAPQEVQDFIRTRLNRSQ